MMWIDIVSIVFICVTANHMGLIAAIEDRAETELPVINCVKCLTFWCVFVYSVYATRSIIAPLAISFLCSYLALWLELLEGYIDTLYLRLYEKIRSDTHDTAATDT